jgi:RNA polymerase sigma-70 factor, ECF subfamily
MRERLDMLGDAELVTRVQRGQREAFAGLVRRHQDMLYRHARGMGIDHDTCTDLVQDAFVRAYQHIADCRDADRFRFWLLRITRNLCLDYLKSVRRLTVPLSTVADADNIAAPSGDGDLRNLLESALGQLTLDLREAFLLKHDAGYTYEEIAELTHASPSAVKMRVHRAREAMETFLSKQGVRAA